MTSLQFTDKEHNILKALAKQAGMNVREYILSRTIRTPKPDFAKMRRPKTAKGKPTILDILFESRGN